MFAEHRISVKYSLIAKCSQDREQTAQNENQTQSALR